MKTMGRNHGRPHGARRVDPQNNWEDRWCLVLLIRGRSNKAIREQTGQTNGQIAYRAKKYECKRSDYRDGTSVFARRVDEVTDELAKSALKKYIAKHLGRKESRS